MNILRMCSTPSAILRALVLLGLCSAAGSTTAGAAGSTDAPAIGLHAGVDDKIAQYDAFGTWLGRKVLYRVVFSDMASWSTIATPWFLGGTRQWLESDPRRVEVISLPLLPKGEEGNFVSIISGQRDAEFRSFAEKIQSRGFAPRVIVRLAWEGNGDWYPWAYGSDPAGFRGAFRRAVTVMRSVAPELRIAWCISCRASRKGGPALWTEGYPGDDVVDIISIDTYDEYNPTWDSILNGEAGLRELREFAIARGKPEAHSEWSCSTNKSAGGGGDNAVFIQNMADWFAARPGGVLYQAYWNTSSGGPNAAIFGPSTVLVPDAAERFRQLFGTVRGASSPLLK